MVLGGLLLSLAMGIVWTAHSYKVLKIAKSSPRQERLSLQADLFIPPKPILLQRPRLITQIEEKFKQRRVIHTLAIVGIGGSGKTTLARHYASLQNASVIAELNAESKRSLMTSFENLAAILAQGEEEKQTLRALQEIKDPALREEKILNFVKETLKGHPNWLLIYDNVEKIAATQKYLPTNPHLWGTGRIIVTTRDSTIQNNNHIHHTLPIGELTAAEKLELFVNIINKGEEHPLTTQQKKQAKEFLTQVPPFPLDVSMAAYYLKATNIPYERYINHVRANKETFDSLQETILTNASEYTKTRYSIITLSLKRLLDIDKDFGSLLLLISMLDSQNIPRELLALNKNELAVDNFIYHMKKYSLLEDTSLPSFQPISSFSMHRSTQDISLAYLTQTLQLENNKGLLQTIYKSLESYIAKAFENEDVPRMKLILPHGRRFICHTSILTEVMRASIQAELGPIYFYFSSYKKAKRNLEDALLTFEKQDPQNIAKIASILVHRGLTYMQAKEPEKAKALVEKSLTLYKRHFPHNHAKIAWVLANVANVYRVLGNYDKARAALEESLSLYKYYLPERHLDQAWGYLFLGYTYEDLGQYRKAKEAFEQSLTICRHSLPDHPINRAWALANLGNIYTLWGDYKKAQDLIEESLSLCQETLPSDHSGLAWIFEYGGIVYGKRGDYGKAKEYLTKSLAIFQKHAAKHSLNARVLFRLGVLEKDHNHYEQARIFLEQSLADYEKREGKETFKVPRILSELGHLYLLEGELDKAEDLLTQALKRLQHDNHPEKYITLEYLATLQLRKADHIRYKSDKLQAIHLKEQAVSFLKQALEIAKLHFPAHSPHILRIQMKLKGLEK